ncbi:MAG: MarR family transcriptional regulator [Saprospiraceae bacterium]|nr:MarR family transcriptional regulator [Bacteroidia bacterium]NNE14068.1 MarR family transcriptional regulator [Saprospiraceae bacterium]NNL91306.1 MarR family transcriptional regulator [Saprospiraceae bacterium]
MRIEEAIKQLKPFVSEAQKAGVNLMFTHNWYESQLSEFFKTYGLTTKQYNILRILKGANKSVSTSFIRERLLDKMSDVSRIVDRMAKKSLVKKETCETDKRLVDVALTEKGISILKLIGKEISKFDALFDNLTENEIIQLNNLLDKFRGE